MTFIFKTYNYAEIISSSYNYVFQYRDHLGNVRLSYSDLDLNGSINPKDEIIEESNYYSYGLKHRGYNSFHQIFAMDDDGDGPGTGIVLTPVNPFLGDSYKYKFGGKEYQEEFDVNSYDFGARNYDPALGRWMNIDPLAELMRRHSPYNYAFNNPVYFIDPDGMMPTPPGDFIDQNGNNIGNDGKNDGKVYAVKTDVQSVESGAPIDGISTSQKDATTSFIKVNSGDSSAFDANSIAYDNSVEIEGGADTRQGMVDVVNQDDGTGGTGTANTTEYGGTVENNGSVIENKTGTDSKVDIKFTGNTKSTFHSHFSGSVTGKFGESLGAAAGPSHDAPKPMGLGAGSGDIGAHQPAGTNYMFDRGSGNVYIYNSNSGVQAIVPQKNFVSLPKN